MKRVSVAAALFAVAIGAAGCGLTSSPADNLSFKPPPSWKGSPGIMGFMQLWRAPSNDQVLMLFKSPKPIQTSQVFSSADLKDASDVTTQHITICGSQPAELMTARGTSQSLTQKRRDVNIAMVMSDAAGATYMALYVYPVGAQPDAGANAALRELCTK